MSIRIEYQGVAIESQPKGGYVAIFKKKKLESTSLELLKVMIDRKVANAASKGRAT